MNCNVSSIILPCLHLDPPSDSVDGLWGTDQHLVGRENDVMIPLWLDEILSKGYPDENILDTLEGVLERNGAVNCCIPEEGRGTSTECYYNF